MVDLMKLYFISSLQKKIEDEDNFNKANNITNLWIKPVNFEKMAASVS